MWRPTLPLGELVVRAVVTYAAILAFLRLAGKRQVGQMGPGDLVALLLISNSVQNAMTGGDNSIGAGLVLAAVIIGSSRLVDYATFKSKRLERLIEGRPRLLVYRGAALPRNLELERMNLHELQTILRRQGVHDVSEVHEAVLESNGSLSVWRNSEVPAKTPPHA